MITNVKKPVTQDVLFEAHKRALLWETLARKVVFVLKFILVGFIFEAMYGERIWTSVDYLEYHRYDISPKAPKCPKLRHNGVADPINVTQKHLNQWSLLLLEGGRSYVKCERGLWWDQGMKAPVPNSELIGKNCVPIDAKNPTRSKVYATGDLLSNAQAARLREKAMHVRNTSGGKVV